MILQILTLLGAMGMFLYGMNMMSSGLQKAAGTKLRGILSSMTSNRFKGVLTGVGVTAAIQSSSATTVMVVGFVNAGLLTLMQAVGVIMGANIGTTITAWIISILGFKADVSILSVPIMLLGFIWSTSKKDKYRNLSEFVVGFALIFLGLTYMKNSVPDLGANPEILSFIQNWTSFGFGSVLIFLLFGTVLTLILQSSSATMALTLIMLGMGWIPFDMAAAMILGENIGTTITANIAASVGSPNARRAALAHTVFNVFGVIWALALYRPFLMLIGRIIEAMGYPNPMDPGFAVTSSTDATGTAALYGVSMLHTLFNCINTMVLIWFTPQIVKLVSTIIKDKPRKEEEQYKLKFINAGYVATGELAVDEAMKEVVHFGKISRQGLAYAVEAINAQDNDTFEIYRQKLVKYEEIADKIEREIAEYLKQLQLTDISQETSDKIRSVYKVISELESLGDSGESISRILSRKNVHSKTFSGKMLKNISALTAEVDSAYDVMINNLKLAAEGKVIDIEAAENAENRINLVRNNLREEEMFNVEHKADYLTSVYYLDIVAELEKMGDYIINISQAVSK